MMTQRQKQRERAPLESYPEHHPGLRTDGEAEVSVRPQLALETTFERLLLPLDGSVHSQQALEVTECGLLSQGTEIHLLQVIRPDGHPDDPPDPGGEQSAREYLGRVGGRLEVTGARVHLHVIHGEPAEEILSLQEQIAPCLTAMSTHGRTGPARWIIGSVAERVLRHSEQPMLLLNPTEQLQADAATEPGVELFRKILVPLDGSSRSWQILPLAQWFASQFGARILLLHCPLTEMYDDVLSSKAPTTGAQVAEDLLEPYRRDLEEAGVEVETRVGDLHPSVEILRIVEQENVDLIAMTTHGRTGLARWAFGSVAEKVVHNSPVPVLLRRSVSTRKLAAELGVLVDGDHS